jgi:hypothetical protein
MRRLQRVGIVQCYLGGYRTKPGFALTFHLSFERDVVKSVRTGLSRRDQRLNLESATLSTIRIWPIGQTCSFFAWA